MKTAIEEIINRGEKSRENLLSVNLLGLVKSHIAEILQSGDFLRAGDVLVELSILVRLKSELLLLLFAVQQPKRERTITEEEDILDVFSIIRRTFKEEREEFKHKYVEREEEREVPVSKLTKIVQEILEREKFLETKTVKKNQYSIRKAMAEINALLEENPELLFQSLFEKKHSKIEIILMFLAILILAKSKKVIIYQSDLFAPIYVKKNPNAPKDTALADASNNEDDATDAEILEGRPSQQQDSLQRDSLHQDSLHRGKIQRGSSQSGSLKTQKRNTKK
jgi:chromatin segregation and condensation protein Rec8/ScpA/Scc1 (kleisin family)